MGTRFLRLIAGLLLIVTIPITVVICLFIWTMTGKPIIEPIVNWIFFGEFEYD